MAEPKNLFAEFPPVDAATWRQLVEDELGGTSYDRSLRTVTPEGLRIDPLYTLDDRRPSRFLGRPGRGPEGSGAVPARVATEYRLDELEPGTLARDVDERGVELLWLRVEAFAGPWLEALEGWLEGVDLEHTALVIDAGARLLPWAAAWRTLQQRRKQPRSGRQNGVLGDPFAHWACCGRLPAGLEAISDQFAVWTRRCEEEALGSSLLVATSIYRRAGATTVDELALALSTAAEWMRRCSERGIDPEVVGRRLRFALSVGTDLFTEIAKLRAARLLWSKLAAACSLPVDAEPPPIHVRSLEQNRTLGEPFTNLLRGTAETFAALTGGADSVATLPYDQALAGAGDSGRRLAINTQHVLRQEGYLDRVADPGGGSWYLESLTDQLARAAWERFRELERDGGLASGLESGAIAARLAASAQKALEEVAHRREVIVGVNNFVDLGSEMSAPRSTKDGRDAEPAAAGTGEPAPHAASSAGEVLERLEEALAAGAGTADLEASLWSRPGPTIEPLATFRHAQPFEDLRRASDRHASEHGRRPRVVLAALGAPAETRDRAEFARRFLATGGVEAVVHEVAGTADAERTAADLATACAESSAAAVVVCSSDERYAETLAPLASALDERGIRVLVAGRPGEREDAYRHAGVDGFIFLGCEAVELLRQVLGWSGVREEDD